MLIPAKKYLFTLLLLAGILGVLLVGIWWADRGFFSSPAENAANHGTALHLVPLPDTIFFAGEPVSLLDPDVRERFEKELFINQYWHSNTILMLKRAGRYFPLIERILAENGIPDDFKYLVPIESQFENQVSPRGAAGFWQFMENTGREFGLIINQQIDERLDPEKATLAACKYLKRSHAVLGNWVNTAASYNIGLGGIKSVMANQYVDSYLDVMVNNETSRYFFRVLAIKYIFENQKLFGFDIPQQHLYQAEPYREVSITQSIADLPLYARQNGFTYKALRRLNPALKGFQLILDAEELPQYVLRIPQRAIIHSRSMPDKLADTTYERTAVLEHLINDKNASAIKAQSSSTSVANNEDQIHIVQKGENLALISKKHQVSVAELAQANGINPDLDAVLPGQRLVIPKVRQ